MAGLCFPLQFQSIFDFAKEKNWLEDTICCKRLWMQQTEHEGPMEFVSTNFLLKLKISFKIPKIPFFHPLKNSALKFFPTYTPDPRYTKIIHHTCL